jgi:isocitrate dehydrogenase (NAD+)
MSTPVTLIAGDGIGPEVAAAVKEIVSASGAKIEWDPVLVGMVAMEKHGTPLPVEALESVGRTKVALKGPTQTPFGGDYRIKLTHPARNGSTAPRDYPSIAIALRKELGLYGAVRPAKNYPGIASRFQGVDLLIFRENSEDLYLGIEKRVSEDRVEATKVITFSATDRMAHFACKYMEKTGRKRLTIGHKANVLKLTDGTFLKVAQEAAAAHPSITCDSRVIDALCMELVIRPETFDSLLLANLYGDIVSDLAAGLVGGLGVAPGANLGDDCAMFEAVHGSAPDIAGKDLANPTALLLSAVMMLRYLEQGEVADRIEAALSKALTDKQSVTKDLGGNGGTKSFTAAILRNLR